MREIKFRAWDREEDSFIDSENLAVNFIGTIFEAHIDEDVYNEIDNTKLELMQYTGLKDKNGKDIFEGDVVKWGHIEKFEECWHRVAVVELFPSLHFHILHYIDGKTLEKRRSSNHKFHYSNFIYTNTHEALEVIGNIYQNQELLEE